ncbi:MAG: ribbon-helix-helix protein, CopG family [bacterium]|nr:ribbon-helix-helix protein, CopG family [bacterium]
MKITRSTEVVSVSLPAPLLRKLDQESKEEGRSRSNFIKNLLVQYLENKRWEHIYRRGTETAQKFNLTSEDDLDRILHNA